MRRRIFTQRFFAAKAAHVDGVDIEPSAIAHARRHYSAPNVSFHVVDVVSQPFPRDEYNVVVWDGALGHFEPATVDSLVAKIALRCTIFCGSESLGVEGSDHLQFFESSEDIARLFRPHFPRVDIDTFSYGTRTEAYWRCFR